MAMNKGEFVSLVRREAGASNVQDVSDDDIVEASLEGAVSGDQHTLHFLAKHNINAGIFQSWRTKQLTNQQREILSNLTQIAHSLHEIDVTRAAHAEGVPREAYSDVIRERELTKELKTRGENDTNNAAKLVDVQADAHIRLKEAESRLEKEKLTHTVESDKAAAEWHERGQLGLSSAEAMRKDIDKLIDEIAALEDQAQTNAVVAKLASRREMLLAQQKKYNVLFG